VVASQPIVLSVYVDALVDGQKRNTSVRSGSTDCSTMAVTANRASFQEELRESYSMVRNNWSKPFPGVIVCCCKVSKGAKSVILCESRCVGVY
jgi:hypothetical protein